MTSMIAINNGNDLKKIEQDIRYTTQVLNSYTSQKNGFNNGLNYAKKMLNGMNESLKYLNTAQDNLKRTFTISGKTADAGNIEKVKDEIQASIKELNNMIATINNTIKSLSSSINYYQNELNKLKRKKSVIMYR